MAEAAHVIFGNVLAMTAASESDLDGLVRAHAQLVFRIAFSVLRNHADAEDAVQETFLKVVRHRRKLDDVTDPKAWLARIAWRVAIDRKRVATPISLDAEESEGATVLRGLCDAGAPADRIAADRQMLALTESLIAGLPRDLRDVTTLATIEELNTRELAEVLEIPEATVRTRLFRARQLLREKLSKVLTPGRALRAADPGGQRGH